MLPLGLAELDGMGLVGHVIRAILVIQAIQAIQAIQTILAILANLGISIAEIMASRHIALRPRIDIFRVIHWAFCHPIACHLVISQQSHHIAGLWV